MDDGGHFYRFGHVFAPAVCEWKLKDATVSCGTLAKRPFVTIDASETSGLWSSLKSLFTGSQGVPSGKKFAKIAQDNVKDLMQTIVNQFVQMEPEVALERLKSLGFVHNDLDQLLRGKCQSSMRFDVL